MRTKLKDVINYWKELREDYIQKTKGEYQVKKSRGMTEGVGKYKCPLCNGEHEIDEYDFVDSCIGYFWMDNMAYHIIEWGKKHEMSNV